jgi:hypothetical protein
MACKVLISKESFDKNTLQAIDKYPYGLLHILPLNLPVYDPECEFADLF